MGRTVKQKLKKKQVKKDPNFGSIFASTALPGFARTFAKLIKLGFSPSEAIKKIKNKE